MHKVENEGNCAPLFAEGGLVSVAEVEAKSALPPPSAEVTQLVPEPELETKSAPSPPSPPPKVSEPEAGVEAKSAPPPSVEVTQLVPEPQLATVTEPAPGGENEVKSASLPPLAKPYEGVQRLENEGNCAPLPLFAERLVSKADVKIAPLPSLYVEVGQYVPEAEPESRHLSTLPPSEASEPAPGGEIEAKSVLSSVAEARDCGQEVEEERKSSPLFPLDAEVKSTTPFVRVTQALPETEVESKGEPSPPAKVTEPAPAGGSVSEAEVEAKNAPALSSDEITQLLPETTEVIEPVPGGENVAKSAPPQFVPEASVPPSSGEVTRGKPIKSGLEVELEAKNEPAPPPPDFVECVSASDFEETSVPPSLAETACIQEVQIEATGTSQAKVETTAEIEMTRENATDVVKLHENDAPAKTSIPAAMPKEVTMETAALVEMIACEDEVSISKVAGEEIGEVKRLPPDAEQVDAKVVESSGKDKTQLIRPSAHEKRSFPQAAEQVGTKVVESLGNVETQPMQSSADQKPSLELKSSDESRVFTSSLPQVTPDQETLPEPGTAVEVVKCLRGEISNIQSIWQKGTALLNKEPCNEDSFVGLPVVQQHKILSDRNNELRTENEQLRVTLGNFCRGLSELACQLNNVVVATTP